GSARSILRHCERSEAIHRAANEEWIASSLSLLAMTARHQSQCSALSLIATKRLCDHLMVVFEDDVSRPVGGNLGYLISVVFENGDERTHLGDMLTGRRFEPRNAGGLFPVVAL